MPSVKYEKIVYEPIKLAYLAGLIDGEGSLCIYKVNRACTNYSYKSPCYRGCLAITNTKKELVDWLDEAFQNMNHKHKKHKRAILNKSSKAERWIYEWVLQGYRLEDILTQVMPYLVIKKRQAEIMLEFRSTYTQKYFGVNAPLDPKTIEKRETLMQEIKILNAKGLLRAKLEHAN